MMNNDLEQYYTEILNSYKALGYDQDLISQWTLPLRDAQTLMGIIQDCQPHNILEVGTFVGMTTLLIALFSSPETHIHTVDPNFPLQVEMESMGSNLYDYDTSIKAQELAFQAAERLGVENKITFHAGGFSTGNTFASYNLSPSSLINIIGPEVCKRFGPFDFVFVDGLHYEEDVFSDLNLAVEHLVPSGAIALHDVLGGWGSNVRRAVFRFLEKHADYSFSHARYSDIFHWLASTLPQESRAFFSEK
jgi:predicted O-methyltransferase YrrM